GPACSSSARHSADTRSLAIPPDPRLLHQTIDLPGAHPVDVRLQHDRDDRPLRAPPRLQKAREVRRPRPLPRAEQVDLPDPRLPPPLSVPLAMRRPPLGRDLADPGADLSRYLGCHQSAGDQPPGLPDEIFHLTIPDLRVVEVGWSRGRATLGAAASSERCSGVMVSTKNSHWERSKRTVELGARSLSVEGEGQRLRGRNRMYAPAGLSGVWALAPSEGSMSQSGEGLHASQHPTGWQRPGV